MTPQGGGLLERILTEIGDDLLVVAAASVAAFFRALFRTIDSGHTGLRFTFGRAGGVLQPGLHLFVPFVQSMRVVPTRSRTMDLPAQRIVTLEVLVFRADANVVFRVVDLHKALIQIDDVLKGMRQMLGLSVQEVLRTANRATIRDTERLGTALHESLQRRLDPWGIEVERAGFPSIAPDEKSIRVTQILEITEERRKALNPLLESTGRRDLAAALVGARSMPVKRTKALLHREHRRRRVLRIRRALRTSKDDWGDRKWTPAQVRRAELSLEARLR